MPKIRTSNRTEDKIIVVLNRLESCANCQALLGDDEESKRDQLRFTDQILGYCTRESVSQAYRSIFKNFIKPNTNINEEFYSKLRLCPKCSVIFIEIHKLFWEFVIISCQNEALLSTIMDVSEKTFCTEGGTNTIRPIEVTIKCEPDEDNGETTLKSEEFIESLTENFEDFTNPNEYIEYNNDDNDNDDPEYDPSGDIEMKCRVCKKFFSNAHQLKLHQKVHDATKCTKCDRVFANRKSLIRHSKRVTPCDIQTTIKNEYNNMDTADAGDRDQETINSLQTQNDVYDGLESRNLNTKNKYKCKVCHKICISSKYLHHHMRSHLKKFQCRSCEKRFRYPYELKSHQLSKGCLANKKSPLIRHSNRVTPCKIRTTKDEYNMDTDTGYIQNNATKVEQYPKESSESILDQNFSNKKILSSKAHGKVHHPIQCKKCDRIFANRRLLRRHLKRVTPCDKGPITSEINMDTTGDRDQDQGTINSLQTQNDVNDGLESQNLNTKYECKVCHKVCTSNNYLHNHMRSHLKKFQCTSCEKRFRYPYELRSHELSQGCLSAYRNRPFKSILLDLDPDHSTTLTTASIELLCHMCSRIFSAPHYLEQHLKSHSEETFKCPLPACLKTFKSNDALQDHVNVHNKTKVHKCPEDECPEEIAFCTRKQLTNHLLDHKRYKGKYECTLCPIPTNTYAFEKNLLFHKKLVHNYNDNPEIICEICAKIFSNHKSYSTHKRHVHGKSQRNLQDKKQCPICKVWLKNEFCLERHKITHKWTKTSFNFPCKICGRSFDKERSLRNHEIYNHSTVKKNICPEPGCKRAFTNMFTLKHHMKQHVVGKPFVCSFEGCTKAYKHKRGLNLHFESIHKYNSPEEFPYECLICKEGFPRQALLNHHRQLKNHIFLTEEEKRMKEQESVS